MTNNNHSKGKLETWLVRLEANLVKAKLVLVILNKSEEGIKTFYLERMVKHYCPRTTFRNYVYILREKGLIRLETAHTFSKIYQVIKKGESEHLDFFKKQLKLIVADQEDEGKDE